jgi:hypothetical protein
MKAKDPRGVIQELEQVYPRLGERLDEETTVAITSSP